MIVLMRILIISVVFNSIQKEMNIEESLLLLINVEVDGEEMPDINMNIIKIGSNWRIYNVM